MELVSRQHPVGSTLVVGGTIATGVGVLSKLRPSLLKLPVPAATSALVGGIGAALLGFALVNDVQLRPTVSTSPRRDARNGSDDLDEVRDLRRRSENQQRLCELAGTGSCPDPAGARLDQLLR